MATEAAGEAPTDRVAAVSAEVNRLARQVARLQAAVAATADLAAVIDDLGVRVNALAGKVQPSPADANEAAQPVAWVEVSAEQAPRMLTELQEWLSTVLVHHRVAGALLPCWYRHPAVVQALLDVHFAWLTAYRRPDQRSRLAVLEWSQHHLPHLEQQLRELLGRCSTVRHEPVMAPPPRSSETELHAYARWWATDRDPAREPAPADRPGPTPR